MTQFGSVRYKFVSLIYALKNFLLYHFKAVRDKIEINALLKILTFNVSGVEKRSIKTMDGLDKASFIDSKLASRLIRLIAYEGRDVRAPWIGAGIAQTNLIELQPFAAWANSHWAMYYGFQDYFAKISMGSILDIGCGTGNMTANLSEVFPERQIEGLDLNSRVLSFAMQFNQNSNVEYKLENAFTQQNQGRFSACFAVEILEHIPAIMHDQFIAGCLAALKPGGLLFLTTPNELDTPDAEYGHIGFLNRERAKVFFKKYKQNIVEVSFYDNVKLSAPELGNALIKGSASDFEKEDGANRSHFRIVMQNNSA